MDLEGLLDAFVEACLDAFGRERVDCIVLHGSALKGGAIPGYSDVDFQVYLSPQCFDGDGNVADAPAFALQERIGPLPWREAGFLYPQAGFLDAAKLPEWWTGPVPGAHRVLWGTVPPHAFATAERLRESSLHHLQVEMPRRIGWNVHNFADADDRTLPRRVRLLGTDVAPTIFALIAYDAPAAPAAPAAPDAPDAIQLWALSKPEALSRLEARYLDAEGPTHVRRFFENVGRLYGGTFDDDLGRETFRTGIAFLRWAEAIGTSLGGDAT